MKKNYSIETIKKSIGTSNEITWCPGCPNFLLLEAIKRAITKMIAEGYKKEKFVIVSGIGCHQKIYDYLNISGIYGLHGRVLPILVGIKLANPNLIALGFAGDGDAYAEGIEHMIHAARYNVNVTYLIANNQNFALTTGQPTPTTQKGYKSKSNPFGEFFEPINPIKIALASKASFVARINPKDIEHSAEIYEKAIKHKGFAIIDSVQDCLSFNLERNNLSEIMYKIEDNHNIKKAYEYAEEWEYNGRKGKIPVGIIYQEERETMEEKIPSLKKLREKKIGWIDL